jgi:hypothetical protein
MTILTASSLNSGVKLLRLLDTPKPPFRKGTYLAPLSGIWEARHSGPLHRRPEDQLPGATPSSVPCSGSAWPGSTSGWDGPRAPARSLACTPTGTAAATPSTGP